MQFSEMLGSYPQCPIVADRPAAEVDLAQLREACPTEHVQRFSFPLDPAKGQVHLGPEQGITGDTVPQHIDSSNPSGNNNDVKATEVKL